MIHQYITTSKLKKTIHFIIDWLVDIYVRLFLNISDVEIKNPQKIVFFSLGHLGDVLILSYIFPLVKEYYPNSTIDVVAPDWCSPILRNNPYLRKVIIHNTFHENRSPINFLRKILLQFNSLKKVIEELREQQYDVSIEGRISYPNGNRIAFKSKIKKRIGFGSGGFGSLLTNEIKFPESNSFHLLEALLKELSVIGIKKQLSDIKSYYNCSVETSTDFLSLMRTISLPFLILHFETGNPNRKVNRDFLIKVVKKIVEETKFNLILCGISNESNKFYSSLLSIVPNSNNRIINAVNKLSIDELFELSKYAKAALTLESLPAHLCAINCETISFYNNGAGSLFFPISNKKANVIHNHSNSKYCNQPNIINYFVKDIESIETYEIVEKLLIEISND
ncbi:MAG: hypothetical protein WAU11_04890 [Ignavibacteriaceae bacterium]